MICLRTVLCFLLPALLLLQAVTLGADVNPRLIVIKVDGLSALLLEAAIDPEGPASEQIPHPDLFREAHREMQGVFRREVLLPNIQRYFFEEGSRVENLFSGTVTLSTPAWAVIDTGQRTVIKNQFDFNRSTGRLGRFLDVGRDIRNILVRDAGRTSSLWQLDLLGIPPLLDAFPADRTWASIHFLMRQVRREQLTSLGEYVLKAGEERTDLKRIARRHLSYTVFLPDMPDQTEAALARQGAEVVLQAGENEAEVYDLVSLLFPTLDRYFHVDPEYRNILSRMVKLDGRVGRILAAVEQSRRRDETLVALLSDHGLDFDPVYRNYAFPISRWMREKEWGGHNVLSPNIEEFAHSLAVPIRGMDFQSRVYESEHCPYGPAVPGGEKGYYTAFLANEGNPRFDAYLRNSDLNRLHLLLLEVRRFRRDETRLQRIFPVFQAAYADARSWLEEDLRRMKEAAAALAGHAENLVAREDGPSRDAATRLEADIDGYRGTIDCLTRLLAVPEDWPSWQRWARKGFRIPDLIPKGYFGPPNRPDQLRAYIAGWKEAPEERWLNGPSGFQRIDYPALFTGFQATNASAYGNHFPFDFVARDLPVAEIQPDFDRPLQQAVWLKGSGDRGEALILESTEGELLYLPIRGLDPSGPVAMVEAAPEADPLGYEDLRARWLTPRQWAAFTGDRRPALVPVILAEIFRPNHEAFLDSPAWRRRVEAAGVEAGPYREALRYRFDQRRPDLRVWAHPGWNVNTRSHTPGGTHGGFSPIENRTIFALWGGRAFDLARGRTLPGVHFTQDILPTLLHLMGMLDREGKVIPRPGSFADEFPLLPGHVIPFGGGPKIPRETREQSTSAPVHQAQATDH